MIGRLLHGLEEGVERLLREHVDLVDDVDLGVPPHGAVDRVGDQLACLFNLAVRRGVDLDHIRVLPAENRLGDPLVVPGVVEFVREYPRHRGLPHASRPAEEVGVVDPVRLDRGVEGARDRLLADHGVEGS